VPTLALRQIAVVALSIGIAASALAQAPTLKQLMLDLIHPASNGILLAVYRGGPANEREWTDARHHALALVESANLLMMPGRNRNQDAWTQDVKLLADAGAAAYKAAQANDAKALAAVAPLLDAACTACHRQYRPDVFPREGGSK
jgi:hypothetical protein